MHRAVPVPVLFAEPVIAGRNADGGGSQVECRFHGWQNLLAGFALSLLLLRGEFWARRVFETEDGRGRIDCRPLQNLLLGAGQLMGLGCRGRAENGHEQE